MSFSVSLVALCSAIYSYGANPRRLESATHPLWTIMTLRLCQVSPSRLWPACQWSIYKSPLDAQEEDPDKTTADVGARGVVTDFAVLLPVFVPPSIGAMKAENNKLSTVLDSIETLNDKAWDCLHWYEEVPNNRFSHYFLPVLVELKRPPTRTAKNIVKFAQSVTVSLNEAREQMEDQARAVFTSRKYARQTKVVLLATSGEFWSFKMVQRDYLAEAYDLQDEAFFHLPWSTKAGQKEQVQQNEDDDDDEDKDEDEEDENTTVLSQQETEKCFEEYESQDQQRQKAVSDAIERRNADRRRVAEERGKGTLEAFANTAQGPPFTQEDLHTLGICFEDEKPSQLNNFKFGLTDNEEGQPGYFVNMHWSPILRLGTPDSHTCMSHIIDLLHRAAEDGKF